MEHIRRHCGHPSRRGLEFMANTELLPPEIETRAPSAPPAAEPAERSVFASMDRMQVKRDPKSTADSRSRSTSLLIGLIAYFVATRTNLITPMKTTNVTLLDPPPPPPEGATKGCRDGRRWRPERADAGYQGKPAEVRANATESAKSATHCCAKDQYSCHSGCRPKPENGADEPAEHWTCKFATSWDEHGERPGNRARVRQWRGYWAG